MTLRIKWKYCECGCKCCTVTILGLHFSYYDPLDRRKPYRFIQSHNARTFGRDMESREAIDDEVRRIVAEHKESLKAEIAEMENS